MEAVNFSRGRLYLSVIVLEFSLLLERFSFECCKTKTKVITLANHKEHRQYSEPIKTGRKAREAMTQLVLVLLLIG